MNRFWLPLWGLILLGLPASPVRAQDVGLEQFFTAVQEGKVENLTRLMHPQLARRIDPPILEAWLQAVAFRLGRVEAIEEDVVITTGDRRELSARVHFTKGIAQAELVFVDQAVVGFEIKSDHLTNWFQRPTSLQLYRQQGEQFLKAFTARNFEGCRQLLHEKIAQQLTDQYLTESLQTIEQEIGTLAEVQYQQARLTVLPDERLRQIDLQYEIRGNRGIVLLEIAIRFHGMQGHIVGFRIP